MKMREIRPRGRGVPGAPWIRHCERVFSSDTAASLTGKHKRIRFKYI